MTDELLSWALPRLAKLLPLDQASLQEILTYADSLPKDASADHLKNLLGDSPAALDFISSFNQRRKSAPAQNATPTASRPSSRQPSPPGDGPARSRPRQPKKKQNIHALPARQIEDRGDFAAAYVKKDEQDYMSAASNATKPKGNSLASALSLSATPSITPEAPSTVGLAGNSSDMSALPSPALTPHSSRPSSPAPRSSPAKAANAKAKVTLVGGKAMHGASSALIDLDSAIRSLEIQTNPMLLSDEDDTKRQCNCMATQHSLLTTAPNCTNCGKIICVKQGLGPCTFCKTPLLSSKELQSILRVLKDERGKERQIANNAAHKRADVSQKPKAFSGRDFLSASANTSATSSPLASTGPSPAGSRTASPGPTSGRGDSLLSSSSSTGTSNADLTKAKEHRDKLLNFQAHNAKRTQIHDEAADYAMPVKGGDGSMEGNMWASPAERAMELKRQQKIMREMEFNARPEWEKKKVVGSIDVSSGKIVRRFVKEKFEDKEQEEPAVEAESNDPTGSHVSQKPAEGAFSRNPLLGKMIRPVWKGEEQDKGKAREKIDRKKTTWRRVQDDLDDNEDVILDGGVYGRDIKVA